MPRTLTSTNQMKSLVKRQVTESLREILTDSDFGLELAAPTVKRLKKSSNSYIKGSYKSFDQILKKYQSK